MVSHIDPGMAVDLPSRHRKTPTSRPFLIDGAAVWFSPVKTGAFPEN